MVAYLKTQSVLELLNNFSNLSTVAYKGVAPIKTNLIKGDIDVGVLNLGEALTEINEGKLCVSVVLANNRMAKIGDSPTAKAATRTSTATSIAAQQ